MSRLGYVKYGVYGSGAGMVAGYDESHVVGVHIVTDPMCRRKHRNIRVFFGSPG